MSVLEICLNIISLVLIEILGQMIITYLIPKVRKMEKEDEEAAQNLRCVKMNKNIITIFIILCGFTALIGVLIFIFPNLITKLLGFNYIATIILWWVPLLFDILILYFMLIEASYNDEAIIVKKPFSKQRIYKFDEITKYSLTGNLVVRTKDGKFTLLNAMAGTNTLREILKEKTISK